MTRLVLPQLSWISPSKVWALFAIAAIVLSLISTGIFQQDVINPGGVPQLWRFVRASWKPDFSSEILVVTWNATLLTLAYAVCGTCFSLIIGCVGGLLCSEVWWEAPWKTKNNWVSPGGYLLGVRSLLAIPRAIHELIWGLLFINLWGTDPLTAVLAIAIPFGAITAKVFAEILDETPRQPLRVLMNSGVPPLAAFFYTLLPQAFLHLLSYSFYRFECSIRAAAVLGIIGAGGLGYQLLLSLQSLRYEQVWTFIDALFLLSGCVDFTSAWMRRQLGCASRLDLNLKTRLGDRAHRKAFPNPTIHPNSDSPTLPQPVSFSILLFLLWIGAFGLVGFSFWYVNADFSKLWAPQTYRFLGEIGRSAFPPDFKDAANLGLLSIQTIAMSVLGITLAGFGGMLLSLPAAHNFLLPGGVLNPTGVTPLGHLAAWAVLILTRSFLLLSRAVPAPVWALVVLFVLFPGILPGAIALGIHNLGILGRLKAEVVENLDERPIEALKAQGTPSLLVFFYGVLPLTLPRFLAYDLYRWEVCMRETAIVGIVGAGGLGYQMTEQLSSFDYRGLIVTLACFLLLTFGIDWISALSRRSLR